MNSDPRRIAQQAHAKGMALRRMILSDAHDNDNEDNRARAQPPISTHEHREQ